MGWPSDSEALEIWPLAMVSSLKRLKLAVFRIAMSEQTVGQVEGA